MRISDWSSDVCSSDLLSSLRNGKLGARMVQVVNSDPKAVFSFVRANADDGLLVALNLTGDAKTVRLLDGPYRGKYRDFFSGQTIKLADDASLHVDAWGYRVLQIGRAHV